MADDSRDYIDKVQSLSRGYHGKELSPEEMAIEFAKHSLEDRVAALDSLDASDGELSLKEAVRLQVYGGALRQTHERLRKAGR